MSIQALNLFPSSEAHPRINGNSVPGAKMSMYRLSTCGSGLAFAATTALSISVLHSLSIAYIIKHSYL